MGAIPRFQSLATLRLTLFGKTIFDYPMEDRHQFFLRNAGIHHFFVGDLPCAVVSLALIAVASGQNAESAESAESMTCEGDTVSSAWAMLVCKALLMLYSMTSTATQLLLTGNCGTQLSIDSRETDDGILEVETVASVMRSTAGSLAASGTFDRTSLWVDHSADHSAEPGGSE
jgi:hypothetical protein